MCKATKICKFTAIYYEMFSHTYVLSPPREKIYLIQEKHFAKLTKNFS